MNHEIENELYKGGADIVHFVDISGLSAEQTQGFAKAVLLCVALPKKFIMDTRDNLLTERDEFLEAERKADELADWLAEYIKQKGYSAYSQSEKSNLQNGNYDKDTLSSVLPHKTIALLVGLGFIGKNNLLVTKEYGCGLSMCTVLTDAPVVTENKPIISPKCGDCRICQTVCPSGAILGNIWTMDGGRESVIDVFKCGCPLKCMVNCPWTLKYAGRNL